MAKGESEIAETVWTRRNTITYSLGLAFALGCAGITTQIINARGDNMQERSNAVLGVVLHNKEILAQIITQDGVIQCAKGFDQFPRNTNRIMQTQPNADLTYEATQSPATGQKGIRIQQHTNNTFTISHGATAAFFQLGNTGGPTGVATKIEGEDIETSIQACDLFNPK